MSRRRLNQQQQARVTRQRERLLNDTDAQATSPGRIVARFGASVIVEPLESTDSSQRQRCHLRAHLNELVVGDEVLWQAGQADDHGVVCALQPRRNVLERPDSRGRRRPLAANLDRLLVVIAPQPMAFPNLIDRYLVAAEQAGITPVLVLNKSDLLDAHNQAAFDHLLARYHRIGYDRFTVCITDKDSLTALAQALQGMNAALAGQSGVGKSSLINALLGEDAARTGALSQAADKGRHTTTTSELFHLPGGGRLIDSPGIREFGLSHLDAEDLAWGFREFRPLLNQCRFRNCRHVGETGCALDAAAEDGQIDTERLDSFRQILHDWGHA